MEDNQLVVNGHTIICHEIEFIEMDNTLDWLLDTAEQYECIEALSPLEDARDIIAQQKQFIFGEGLLC